MTVSIRLTRSGAPIPSPGFAGALGGTIPGPSTELVIESDEFSDALEAREFVEFATPIATAAFWIAVEGEPLDAGEVEDSEGEAEDDLIGLILERDEIEAFNGLPRGTILIDKDGDPVKKSARASGDDLGHYAPFTVVYVPAQTEEEEV